MFCWNISHLICFASAPNMFLFRLKLLPTLNTIRCLVVNVSCIIQFICSIIWVKRRQKSRILQAARTGRDTNLQTVKTETHHKRNCKLCNSMKLSTRLPKLEQTWAVSVNWTYPFGKRSAQPDMNPGSRNTQKATRVRSNIDTRIWSTLGQRTGRTMRHRNNQFMSRLHLLK